LDQGLGLEPLQLLLLGLLEGRDFVLVAELEVAPLAQVVVSTPLAVEPAAFDRTDLAFVAEIPVFHYLFFAAARLVLLQLFERLHRLLATSKLHALSVTV